LDQLFSSVVVLFPTAARAGATAQLQSINHLQVLLLTSPILIQKVEAGLKLMLYNKFISL
jgi:hypothetical protein